MSQLEPTLTPTTTPIPDALSRRPQALVAGTFVLLAVLLLGVALASGTLRLPGAGATPANVTDGWMHGTAAFAMSGTPSSGVTDGWAGRYLPSAQAVNVTDGWAGRYLPSAQAVNVTDGWAGRYLH